MYVSKLLLFFSIALILQIYFVDFICVIMVEGVPVLRTGIPYGFWMLRCLCWVVFSAYAVGALPMFID